MTILRDNLIAESGGTPKPDSFHPSASPNDVRNLMSDCVMCSYNAPTFEDGSMFCNKCGWAWSATHAKVTDAVLASPDMQSIKAFIEAVRADNTGYDHLLTPAVIEWVMSDD